MAPVRLWLALQELDLWAKAAIISPPVHKHLNGRASYLQCFKRLSLGAESCSDEGFCYPAVPAPVAGCHQVCNAAALQERRVLHAGEEGLGQRQDLVEAATDDGRLQHK